SLRVALTYVGDPAGHPFPDRGPTLTPTAHHVLPAVGDPLPHRLFRDLLATLGAFDGPALGDLDPVLTEVGFDVGDKRIPTRLRSGGAEEQLEVSQPARPA